MASNTTITNKIVEYPDVLGMITGGPRFNIETVQCAFGVFPASIAVGQALEALILLQNACDKPVQANVTIVPPRKDAEGNRVIVVLPKNTPQITLGPGETGLLHVPVAPIAPTNPSQNNTLGVKVALRTPRNYTVVRPAHGGRAASILNMSPFRLNILREVGFTALHENGMLTQSFNILPGAINAPQPQMVARYESLWTYRELPQEQAKYQEMSERAFNFAQMVSRTQVMQPLHTLTEKKYERAGLHLHPAEVLFITKLLTYLMEDGPDGPFGSGLANSSWFHRLASVVNDEALMGNIDKLVAFLYTAVVRDAVQLGLRIIEQQTREKLGTPDEHVAYADEVVTALETGHGIDLSHAYLPLVLAGITLNTEIRGPRENPWSNLNQLREAWRGRVKLAGSQFEWVGNVLSTLLSNAEQALIRANIPRPAR